MGSNEATRFCVIRHGETEWNAELRIQGHRDMPLNDLGREQARAVAVRLKGHSFAAAYCSDLIRARQTAQPLVAALGVALQLESGLRERNFGCCEGRTVDEIEAGDAVIAQGFCSRQPDYVLPGGESLLQHLARIEASFSRMARRHPGQDVLVVTHGGVLDLIYRRAHGVPLEKARDFPLPNASINWLTIDGDCWRIETWGATDHLGGRVPRAVVRV